MSKWPMGDGQSKTFVLVHGAWHGGWCYARVAERLRARGHRVYAPTLTGLGERSHLFGTGITLSTHIADVVNVLLWEGLERVILAGHSYGGLVAAGAAEKASDRIKSLVYLDAFLPSDGKSFHDLIAPDVARAQIEGATADNGFAVPPIAASVFNVNAADRAWVDSLCTPQPLATLTEPLRLHGGAAEIAEHVYVLATLNPLVQQLKHHYEYARRTPHWTAHRLRCGHDVMIDMPGQTADILLRCGDHP